MAMESQCSSQRRIKKVVNTILVNRADCGVRYTTSAKLNNFTNLSNIEQFSVSHLPTHKMKIIIIIPNIQGLGKIKLTSKTIETVLSRY